MNRMTRRKLIQTAAVAATAATGLLTQSRAQDEGEVPAPGRGGRGGRGPARPAGPVLPDTEWHHYAGDLASTRYVPVDQINASNFNTLEVAWRFRTDPFGDRLDGNLQATPVLAKGRLYTTVGLERDVVCIDAGTGEVLWMHRDPAAGRRGARSGSGHGVTYWTDGQKERIIYVTIGYELVSLDAKTGLPDPAFGVKGTVDLRLDDDQEMDLLTADNGLHSTPLIAKNTVVVGCAHAGGGRPKSQKNVKGYVRAFDVATGKRKWIFHTIPKKGEFGYDTWVTEGQAELAGNTGVWAQMSADEQLGMVYIGVELPTGDSVGIYRAGNALFGESLVALDLETGLRKWHYQMVHHGIWDMDVPCASIICDIPHEGKIVKAIAQPTKQSYLYVLNRETGEPIWPIPEMPVAKGDVPGEWYSPTQPMPTKPPAFDRQGVLEKDLNDFTPEIKARALAIAKHYKMGPLFTPQVIAKDEGPWGTLLLPNQQGGANWPGGSYDPETHTVYVYSKTVLDASGLGPNPDKNSDFATIQTFYGQTRGTSQLPGNSGRGGGRGGTNDAIDAPITRGMISIEGLPLHKPPYGRITALDLSDGTMQWQVAHGETPDVIRNHRLLKGVTIPRTGQSAMIGVMTTKSLVICGDGGVYTDEKGRVGARLRAYDKATGEEKGAVFMPTQQVGALMSYVHGGQQYIVVPLAGTADEGSSFIAYRLPNG